MVQKRQLWLLGKKKGCWGVHCRQNAREKKKMPLLSSDWNRGGKDWCQSRQLWRCRGRMGKPVPSRQAFLQMWRLVHEQRGWGSGKGLRFGRTVGENKKSSWPVTKGSLMLTDFVNHKFVMALICTVIQFSPQAQPWIIIAMSICVERHGEEPNLPTHSGTI